MRRLRQSLSIRMALLILWVVFAWFAFSNLRIKSEQIDRPPMTQLGCIPSADKKTLPHGIATVAMPLNWRIGPKDVAWSSKENYPDLIGRYIGCKVDIGEPVVERDVVERPVIAPADGRATYLLKSDVVSRSGVSSSLNTGMRVQIFGVTGAPVVDDARVLAMICSDQCSPVLEMTSAERQLLMRENQAQLQLAVRK